MLLQIKYKNSKELKLFQSTVVMKSFLNGCLDIFDPLVHEKAAKVYMS